MTVGGVTTLPPVTIGGRGQLRGNGPCAGATQTASAVGTSCVYRWSPTVYSSFTPRAV